MEIETYELAPGCWILAIGVERADRDVAGLTGKTATPQTYQAAWSTDGKWTEDNTMTFTTIDEAEQYRTVNRQRMLDASSEF
ncbi:MAG TPA: hypothetical protein VGM98_02625 [Schlesneria sp.]|jgi:hypothetical protein